MNVISYALVGLCVVLGAYIGYLWAFEIAPRSLRISTLEKDLGEAQKEVAELKVQNATLTKVNNDFKTATETQNKAVEALNEAMAKNEAAYKASVSATEKRVATYRTEAERLRNLPPPPPDKQCTALFEELGKYVQRRHP